MVDRIVEIAYGIVRMVGVVICTLLLACCLFSTQYINPGSEEIPVSLPGTGIIKIVAPVLFFIMLLGASFLTNSFSNRTNGIFEKIVLVCAILWVGLCSIIWNQSLTRIPEGDQAFIYGGASYIIEGSFSFFEPGGYFQIYPQQLGLVALMELLFRIVGTYNYQAYQVMSSFFAASIPYIGYCILKEVKANSEARISYLLLQMLCLPLIFYTSWVYGDVPSILFAMIVALLFIKLSNHHKIIYVVGITIFSVLALLVRRNSAIMLVAIVLLTILHIAKEKSIKLLWPVVLLICFVFISNFSIIKMYEARSGYEIGEGLPVNSWIAMGMQEQNGVCGWYNNMPKEVGNENAWNFDIIKPIFDNIINERIDYFIDSPYEAVRFYGRKVISQWNEPLYQSVYFSSKKLDVEQVGLNYFYSSLYSCGPVFFLILKISSWLQIIVYAGALLYFCFCIDKTKNVYSLILPVTIIGGFLFSIIWEAKARYSFPYYIMMFILAVIGYESLVSKILNRKQQRI